MAAVTLDLWHTLMYLSPDEEEAYMAHQLAIGTEVLRSAKPIAGQPARTDDELRRAFERAYDDAVTRSTEGVSVTPAEQIARAALETGRDANPQEYLDRLRGEVGRTRFRQAPGALELLAELRHRGYRVGIISNTVGEPGAFLRPALSSMGFDRYVESYVFSDEHPWSKPSPEIFRFALDQLATPATQAVHVGDSWSDVEGARRAGFRGEILFSGLRSYGERYRRLFLTGVAGEPAANYSATRLEDVGPIIEQLLPVD